MSQHLGNCFFVAADYHILILLVCVYVRRHVFLGADICVAFFKSH